MQLYSDQHQPALQQMLYTNQYHDEKPWLLEQSMFRSPQREVEPAPAATALPSQLLIY